MPAFGFILSDVIPTSAFHFSHVAGFPNYAIRLQKIRSK